MSGVIDLVTHSQEILVDLLELADYVVKVRVFCGRADEGGGQGEGVAEHLNPVGDDGDLVVEVFVDEECEDDACPVDDEEKGDSGHYGCIYLGHSTGDWGPINWHDPEETENLRVEFVKVAKRVQLTHGGGMADVLMSVATDRRLRGG